MQTSGDISSGMKKTLCKKAVLFPEVLPLSTPVTIQPSIVLSSEPPLPIKLRHNLKHACQYRHHTGRERGGERAREVIYAEPKSLNLHFRITVFTVGCSGGCKYAVSITMYTTAQLVSHSFFKLVHPPARVPGIDQTGVILLDFLWINWQVGLSTIRLLLKKIKDRETLTTLQRKDRG